MNVLSNGELYIQPEKKGGSSVVECNSKMCSPNFNRRQYLEVEVEVSDFFAGSRREPTNTHSNTFWSEGGVKGHVWCSWPYSKRCGALLLDEEKQEIFLS